MSKVKFRQQTRVISGREARRMGEREQKREERQKQIDAFWALSPQERAQRMADNEAFQRINRNGITIEDLKRAEDDGVRAGYERGADEMLKTCYAAMCLALHDVHGFDGDACMEMLRAADERVTYAINSQELLDELDGTLGIEFHFKAELGEERIQQDERGA